MASTTKLDAQSRSEIQELFKLAAMRRAMLPRERKVELRRLAGQWILSKGGSPDEKLLLSLRNALPEGCLLYTSDAADE